MKEITNKVLTFIIIIFLILSQNIIYAAMADYTDEQADLKTKQEQENWKKEQEEKINKSNNNYLKSLSVTGYDLYPSFDKKIINYEITKEVEEDYIEIVIETEDEKASVSGNGKIALNSGENNLKINVTADNGEERLYFIKVIKTIKKDIRLNGLILKISDGYEIEITPQFDKDIFEYSCNIQNDIDKIDIEAVANDSDYYIEIIGNENLKEGQNEIIISVSKNDDEKTIYKINVNREKAMQLQETNKNKYAYIIFIVIVFIILLLLIIYIMKKQKKHGKHN